MGLKDFSVFFLFKPNSKYIFSEDKSQKGQKTKLDEVLRPLRELLSFEEAEEDLEDQGTEIEEAEMSNEGKKFTTFSHSQMKHYFFSYLLTSEVDLIEILEIMAQM